VDDLLYDSIGLFINPNFQDDVMSYFRAVGHIENTTPLVVAEDILHCIYTELNFKAHFDKEERLAFSCIEELSHLFTLDNDVFNTPHSAQVRYYAVSLNSIKSDRTTIANVILNAFAKNTSDYIVIMFRHDSKCLLSFAKKTIGCVTFFSDWFDYSSISNILQKSSIANLSLQNSGEFFLDFAYMMAREYYTHPKSKDLIHSEWYLLNDDDYSRLAWNDYAQELMFGHIHDYGDDYIEPPNNADYQKDNFDESDFDFDLLELELDEMIAAGLDIEDDEYGVEEEDFFFDESEQIDISHIPSEILSDPVKLLKWLEKNEQTEKIIYMCK